MKLLFVFTHMRESAQFLTLKDMYRICRP